MNIERLEAIIRDCFPKEAIDPESPPEYVKIIDVYAMQVAVDVRRAESHREELLSLLADWPSESWGQPVHRLEEGPSYIEVSAVVGDQRRAFILFAIGEALGLWSVITPRTLGFSGEEADRMAGSGFVMIEGYTR